MQLVLGGIILTKIADMTVQLHNRVWRDVRVAIRKTRAFKEREWAAEAVEGALLELERLEPSK